MVRNHNIYKNLSVDQIDKLIEPYLRVFAYRGNLKNKQIRRFLRLICEKLDRNEISNQLDLIIND